MAESYIYYSLADSGKNSDNVSFRMKLVSELKISTGRTNLNMQIQYRNIGSQIELDSLKYTIHVNGEQKLSVSPSVILESTGNDWSNLRLANRTVEITHDSSGGGSYKIESSIKDNQMWFWQDSVWEISKIISLENIDVSDPKIENFTISADRYGFGAAVSFAASHDSYPITNIKFEITGMTYAQAIARYGKKTEADKSNVISYQTDNYGLRLQKYKNMKAVNEICFDLDSINPTASPLDSGGSYPFTLEITAENNKTASCSGILTVPQKVTGIECDSKIELLPGVNDYLHFTVLPTNAQEQSVTFESSDASIAKVSTAGEITAVSEGTCQISVTTVDGGFMAFCTVVITDKSSFPELKQIDYLSTNDVHRISVACEYVRNELITKGISVPALEIVTIQGRNHPVKLIKLLLETIEQNCRILRSSAPFEITSVTENQAVNKNNTDWWKVINNWILLLNEIHNKTVEV